MRLNRAALAGLLAVLFLLVGTGTAQADPAEPTNYESTIFDVDPASDAARFQIVGGDAFVEVEVSPGHEVLIPGYFQEPYLRIGADGSVWVNEDSPAFYINQDRYGNVQAPPEADGKGDPRWKQVGSDGHYSWQDHRVHWMSLDLPPTIVGDRYQVVFPWEFPVVIDGAESSVRGELVWVPSRNPYWPLLAGFIGLLPLVLWDRLTTPTLAGLVGLGVGAALAIALLQLGGTPASARGVTLSVVVPAVAGVVAAVAVVLRHRVSSRALLAGGGMLLVVWAFFNIGTLWLPVLPSAAMVELQRVGVAFVLWVSVAIVAITTLQLVRNR